MSKEKEQLLNQLEEVVVDASQEADEKVDELTNEVEELKQKINKLLLMEKVLKSFLR